MSIDFNKLINKFNKVPPSQKRDDKTIFEISGYPHYENVISNILAFFFDETNNHKLGNLLADSLIDAIPEDFLIRSGIDKSNISPHFEVEREVQTKATGRIDLVLSNDTCCIVLENKIWADLTNDLKDYMNHASKNYDGQPIGIVLSLSKVETKHEPFHNVLYTTFINKIRVNLGQFVGSQNNNKYLLWLIELITNLERLSEGKIVMNPEFVDFIKNNEKEVLGFETELKAFHDGLREIVKDVNSIISQRMKDNQVEQYRWRELPKLWDIVVSEFDINLQSSNVKIVIDSWISPRVGNFVFSCERTMKKLKYLDNSVMVLE